MKIVTIGGGTGGSLIDESLCKKYKEITAVVTSFDDGGSSGILRKDFATLPYGDIRRRIFAQKNIENDILEKIYEHRFGGEDLDNENFLEKHSFGNLMILAATRIWGEKEGIEKVCELFKISGKVLPVTYSQAELGAKFSNGERIIGEDLIGQSSINNRVKSNNKKIEKIYLTKEVKINKNVAEEIKKAKYIILCPGDFYTSLLPNFLVPGFCEAVKISQAKIILFVNIMTKASETQGFKVSDFINQTEKYLRKKVDFVVVNNKKINKKLLEKYKRLEGAEQVVNDVENDSRIVELPLTKTNGHIRHDTNLVLEAFEKVISKEYEYDIILTNGVSTKQKNRSRVLNR